MMKSSIKYYKGMVEAVIVSIEDAYNLPLFNPIVKSYRYNYMESLAKANKLNCHMTKDLYNKIIELLNSGLDGTKLVKHLIENENIRMRPKAIRRIKQNMVMKK